jgi:hypothetical protein
MSNASLISARIRGVQPPACLPMEYPGDQETRTNTKIDTTTVKTRVIPRVYKIESQDDMIELMIRSMTQFHDSPDFPMKELKQWEEEMHHFRLTTGIIRPSGVAGISQYLGTTLFERINYLLFDYCGCRETRYWKVIGISGTGQGHWGFYVNDILVCVVNLKPNVVSAMVLRIPCMLM